MEPEQVPTLLGMMSTIEQEFRLTVDWPLPLASSIWPPCAQGGMQVKYSIHREKLPSSVANADQVIAKLLHRVGRRTRLNGFWIMRDKNGLCRLDNNHAFFPLARRPLARSYQRGFLEHDCTFLPYKLRSSAFIMTYLLPPICKPSL